MRITAFDDLYPLLLASGGTLLVSASGSNSGYSGGDVTGEPGGLSVIGLGSTVSLSSNLSTGVVLGDVLTIIQASPAIARFATSSNTGSAGSNSLLRTTGGAGAVTTIAASGAAQTLMIGGANTFDITLTDACSLQFAGQAAPGSESNVLLILRQDGSGGRTVTWPGSVTWASGSAPTLSTTPSDVDFVVLDTVDGGTTWFGFPVGSGGGGTPATTVESETTFGIAAAVGTDTEYARQDHTHGTPADPVSAAALAALGVVGPLLVTDTPAGTPLVFADLLQNEAGTDLMYADIGA